MKKTLIALAAVAAAGVASAQSNVTVYGIADVVLHKDAGNSAQLTSGGVSGSRLGFTGSEDLGGGLKAIFKLETGIDLTSGTSTGFSRETTVGLSGDFGTFRIGRMASAYDDYAGVTNPVFDSVLAPTNVWDAGYTVRPDQGMYYQSPSFGGVSAAVSYNIEQAAGNQNVLAFALSYENGPLFVGLAYQDEGDAADKKYTRLNASYDFGSFKLMGGYGVVNTANDVKQYTIGADIPVASNVVVSLGYASSKQDVGDRANGYSIGVAYALSKRTTVYGGYYNDNAKGLATLDSRFGVGIKHTF